MHVFTGLMRERVDAFNTIIEKNAEALAHPNVRKVLGAYTTSLTAVNEQLFLPNIRGIDIVLPKRRQNDNHAALLPILPSDPTRGLKVTPMMSLPGKEQLDRTQQRITSGKSGLSETEARHAVLTALMDFRTDTAQASLDEYMAEVNRKRLEGLFPTSATIGNHSIMTDQNDVLYGRQMIVVPSELAAFSTPAVASVSLREALHVDDNDNMRFEDLSDKEFHIRKALRGYHVGALILGCMADNIFDTDSPVTATTLYVESLRQQSKQGTDEPPFSVNTQIAAYFGSSY